MRKRTPEEVLKFSNDRNYLLAKGWEFDGVSWIAPVVNSKHPFFEAMSIQQNRDKGRAIINKCRDCGKKFYHPERVWNCKVCIAVKARDMSVGHDKKDPKTTINVNLRDSVILQLEEYTAIKGITRSKAVETLILQALEAINA